MLFSVDSETCSEQSERNSGTGEYYSPKRSVYAKQSVLRTLPSVQRYRVLIVCYVRCARCPQMLCACVSLCLRSVGRSPSCAKMRRAKYRTQASVSAEKEKTRTKFVLIFLWCGHRDLNSDGVTIRPSNVRVCLFRHDRLTLLII